MRPNREKYFKRVGYEPMEHQREFHDAAGKYRVRAVSGGRRLGKSEMVGHDRGPIMFEPKKLGWIVGPCVDDETEILTERGWLTHDQLRIGDTVLTINKSGEAEWQECTDIHRHDGQHRMIHHVQRAHDSMTTGNHRWLVGYTGSISGQTTGRQLLGYRFVTTDTMVKNNEFVPCAAKVRNLPIQPKYDDGLVELVGWYWTEGTDQAVGNGVIIYQDRGDNSDRINRAAYSVFGPPQDDLVGVSGPAWREWYSRSGISMQGRVNFNSEAGKILRDIAPDKVIRSEFIAELTDVQLELLIDTSVRADGHERVREGGHRERVVIQSRKDRLDPIQMAAQLAGYQTTLLYQEANDNWILNIFTRNKVWLGANKHKRVEVDYWGIVWCPSTPNKTWLARRNGTVYFTGNSYDLALKEFRVMWDDIIIQLKMGHDKRIKKKFNPDSGDMYIEMPWGARVECRSTKYKDTLVGEGLDWVVYSEAAKIPGDVHQRYVRGALADKRGEIIACTTPEGKNWFYKDLWYPGAKGTKAHWAKKYPSWVNTVVFPGGEDDPEIVMLRETTLEEWFDQEYGAEFTAVVGRILGEFDETMHIKKHEFNPAWPNYITFDWGFANPLAAMEFQVAPDDTIHVWREHYYRHRTLEWHIEQIKQRENPEGYRLDGGFGDCADPEQVAYASQHLIPIQASPKAKENWLTGIRLYKRMLKEQTTGMYDAYERPIMKPHYYVDPSCEEHISELLGYRTKDNASPNEFKSAGVVDRSCDDHSLDAMRYALMHLFEIGKYHLSDASDDNRTPNWADGKTKRERIDVPVPAGSAPGTFFSYRGAGLNQRF